MNRFKLVILLIAASSILCQDTVKKTPQEILDAGNKGRQMLADLKNGNRHMVIAALRSGADPNIKNEQGETVLFIAVQNNDAELVELLLKHDANPNVVLPNHNSPISIATSNKNQKMVELLLEHGANPNVKNQESIVPLMIALRDENFELALKLIQHPSVDVDVNLEGDSIPEHYNPLGNKTPIQLAAALNNINVVKELLTRKADPNKFATFADSPISIAASNRNQDMVELLLEHGADPNVKKHKPRAPLMIALRDKNFELALKLIQHPSVDVNLDVEPLTAIQLAVQYNKIELVRALLEKGADPNKYKNSASVCATIYEKGRISKTKETIFETTLCIKAPLAEAIYQGNYEMADLLLKYNAKVDTRSLAYSIVNKLDILNRLINKESANLPILMHFPTIGPCVFTPLQLAIEYKNSAAAIKLINAGAEVDARYDNYQNTALIHAAYTGQNEIIDALLRHNANPTLANSGGRTPLQLARRLGDHQKLYEATQRWNRMYQAASSSSSEDTEIISSKYKEAVEQIEAPWKK